MDVAGKVSVKAVANKSYLSLCLGDLSETWNHRIFNVNF